MASRFCATCGTEVDETAAFCPTCGQPLDEAAELQMPPAPAWPEPEPRSPAFAPRAPDAASSPPARDEVTREVPGAAGYEPAGHEPAGYEAPGRGAEPPPAEGYREPVAPRPDFLAEREEASRWGEPSPSTPPPPPAAAAPPPPPPPAAAAPPPPPAAAVPPQAGSAPAGPTIDLPITWPVTLSGWLIGGGAAVGGLGALTGIFVRPFNAWDILLLLLLAAIAVTVFFSARIPAIPNLRLITLVVVLVAVGMALDRIGFGVATVGTFLLLMGTAAAAIGAVLLELGRDQPMGGPRT